MTQISRTTILVFFLKMCHDQVKTQFSLCLSYFFWPCYKSKMILKCVFPCLLQMKMTQSKFCFLSFFKKIIC